MPNEPAMHAALAADPELFDYALERNVLLVGPTSLIGLLRTMELGWRQERMVAEAAEIAEAAGTLHSRFSRFLGEFERSAKASPRRPPPTTRRSARWRPGCSPSCARSRVWASPRARRSSRPNRPTITVRQVAAPELREAPEEREPTGERDAA